MRTLQEQGSGLYQSRCATDGDNAESIAHPLIVDLDGTLTPVDTLFESVLRMIKKEPLTIAEIPIWLLKGRAFFKMRVAARGGFSANNLPLRDSFVEYVRGEHERGRKIFLATAAHRTIAEAVAARLGLFDGVLASDNGENLKGVNKLAAIQKTVGTSFVYAGDSTADLPIWKASKAAVLVGTSPKVTKSVRSETAVEQEFAEPKAGIKVWLRAFRAHQWLKNLLLFVPLLTAFSFFHFAKLLTLLTAFVAFSLAASATYIFNDLWDLDSDRAHPRKRTRPFASGALSVQHGVGVALCTLAVAMILAAHVSLSFLLMLGAYLVLTSAYSWALKEYVLIDVLMLSLLYTLRILAGSVAADIPISSWLLAFSVFVFLSLALVKRCSELVSFNRLGRLSASGRDYNVSDLTILWPMGIGAGLSAVVVFCLFINAAETQQGYATPDALWLAAVGLTYWVGRLWIKTGRGEMHDDPLVFAFKDYGSRVTLVAILVATLAARFLSLR